MNRIKPMKSVVIEMYYTDEPDRVIADLYCLIGEYPEDPTDEEEDEDKSVFFYFRDLDEIKEYMNPSDQRDFVVTHFEIFGGAV